MTYYYGIGIIAFLFTILVIAAGIVFIINTHKYNKGSKSRLTEYTAISVLIIGLVCILGTASIFVNANKDAESQTTSREEFNLFGTILHSLLLILLIIISIRIKKSLDKERKIESERVFNPDTFKKVRKFFIYKYISYSALVLNLTFLISFLPIERSIKNDINGFMYLSITMISFFVVFTYKSKMIEKNEKYGHLEKKDIPFHQAYYMRLMSRSCTAFSLSGIIFLLTSLFLFSKTILS